MNKIQMIGWTILPFAIIFSFLYLPFESKKSGYVRFENEERYISDLEKRVNVLSYVLERNERNEARRNGTIH